VRKVGRYRIAFGPVLWFQTKAPVRICRFLWFWFIREVRPQDIDKKRRFPIGTIMEYEGRPYYYAKAGKDIIAKQVVEEEDKACQT